MKLQKLMMLGLPFALSVSMLYGCGKQTAIDSTAQKSEPIVASAEANESQSIPTESIEPIVAEPSDEGKKIVGTKSDAVSVLRMEMTNQTGMALTGISVQNEDGSTDSGNLLPENEKIEADEIFVLYYDSEEAVMKAAGTEKVPSYKMTLVFENGEQRVLSEFPFSETEACTLRSEDGIVFLTYISLASGTEMSSKELESTLQTTPTPTVSLTPTPTTAESTPTETTRNENNDRDEDEDNSAQQTRRSYRSSTNDEENDRGSDTGNDDSGQNQPSAPSSEAPASEGEPTNTGDGENTTPSEGGSTQNNSSEGDSDAGGSSSGDANGDGSSEGGSSEGGSSGGGSSDGGSSGGSSDGGSSEGGSSGGGSSDGGSAGSSDGGDAGGGEAEEE